MTAKLPDRWLPREISIRAALLVIATIITLPQMVYSVVLLQRYAASERARAEIELVASAKGAARSIDEKFASAETELKILASSPLLSAGGLEVYEQLLRQVSAETGRSFTLTDRAGRIVISTRGAAGGSMPALDDPSRYEVLFRGERRFISDVITGALTGELAAAIGVPIMRNGEVLWVLSRRLYYNDFTDVLANPGVPTDWVVSIVDRSGRHLARRPGNKEFAGQPMVKELVEHLSEGGGRPLRTTTLEGISVISTVVRAPESGWGVGLAQPDTILDAPLRRQLRDAIATGLALLAAALTLAWLVARQVELAVAHFVRQSQALALGQPLMVQPSGFRETRSAGEALAQASAELQARDKTLREFNAYLEERVAARTAELQDANTKLVAEAERRKETESRIRQMQKVEAIGQLTGGIAHDFNNMLAVVLGSLRLLEQRLKRGEPNPQEFIATAKQGAERAAALTRRLLIFARQQPLTPEAVDVNELLSGMSDLLRRTIAESIKIETVLAADVWRTRVDPNEFEAAVLNLAVNARDAMPDGGRLTIETANVQLDDAYAARHSEVTAGQYVLIVVSDTGSGMSAEVADRAFEPFFTTKGVGKGTGLGLSQVYGLVKQSGGHVKLYSEVGQGLSVKLYLPRYDGADASVGPRAMVHEPIPLAQCQAPILVVEDDADVMKVTVGMLSELGYRTILADGGLRALQLLDEHPEVALMFTDIVMPGMSGRQLVDEAVARRPGLKVLYTTGYTRNAVVNGGVIDQAAELIMKPFSLEALARKVDEVLRRRL